MRNSDDVLEVFLILAGRQQTAAVQKLVDVQKQARGNDGAYRHLDGGEALYLMISPRSHTVD